MMHPSTRKPLHELCEAITLLPHREQLLTTIGAIGTLLAAQDETGIDEVFRVVKELVKGFQEQRPIALVVMGDTGGKPS